MSLDVFLSENYIELNITIPTKIEHRTNKKTIEKKLTIEAGR